MIVDDYIPMFRVNQWLLLKSIRKASTGQEYARWYDADTKEKLCGKFMTLRDEAVLRLTFESFRIDEVLSMTLDSYNATE